MPDDNDEILYHYCSTETFYSIIKHKSIWLSSVSQSNDSMEGKILSDILSKEIVDNPLQSTIGLSELKDLVLFFENENYGLSFSLSKAEDLLSQWRGYADNGSGVSIGFSKKYLENLSKSYNFSLKKIVYLDPNKPDDRDKVKPVYEKTFKKENGEFNIPSLMKHSFFTQKNHAFHEEKEVRLLLQVKKGELHKVLFRGVGQQIIPYTEIKFDSKAIIKVIIGPKNKTPEDVIIHFLLKEGFKIHYNNVIRSNSTYR